MSDPVDVHAATASVADGEVFCLSVRLVDRSVRGQIERVHTASGAGTKIAWPAQLEVRINATTLCIGDKATGVFICTLPACDPDVHWICPYLRLLFRCNPPAPAVLPVV